MKKKGSVVIYQAKSGAIELRGDVARKTVWASLDQLANLYGRDKSVISRHLKNVFKEGELKRNSVVAKNATTADDGKTYQVEYYNLDAILSVGYRVNSKTATLFRQWATETLRSYLMEGYVINKKRDALNLNSVIHKKRVAFNHAKFVATVKELQKLLPDSSAMGPGDAMELVSLFADTWLSLDAYDKGELPKGKLTKKKVQLTADTVAGHLTQFKHALQKRGEASELFGAERHHGMVAGIVGNVMQSFGGQELYPSAEEKAAHLLYFMVKNHPFSDGNKRSGAYAFVWFLSSAGILDTQKLTPSALTALTILVAESNPDHKDRIVQLILGLITKKSRR